MTTLKQRWRPIFAWVFIAFFAGLGLTILGLLIMGQTSLDSAAGVLVAMIGAGGTVTGAYAAGRSWEKRHGMADLEPPQNMEGMD